MFPHFRILYFAEADKYRLTHKSYANPNGITSDELKTKENAKNQDKGG